MGSWKELTLDTKFYANKWFQNIRLYSIVPYLNRYQMVGHENKEILFACFINDKRLLLKSIKAKNNQS